MILANDPQIRSFIHVNEKHPFPIQNLAFGIFSDKKNSKKRVGVAIGDEVLDLFPLVKAGLFDDFNEDMQSLFENKVIRIFIHRLSMLLT